MTNVRGFTDCRNDYFQHTTCSLYKTKEPTGLGGLFCVKVAYRIMLQLLQFFW